MVTLSSRTLMSLSGGIFRRGVLFSRKSYPREEFFWGEDLPFTPARPQVGKLVVACHWSAVYSTEP